MRDDLKSSKDSRQSPSRKLFLLVVGIGVILSPIICCAAFFFWIGWGAEWVFVKTIPFYPQSQQVSWAYGYYGADSGEKILYYWTHDEADKVRAYYEAFLPPFTFNKQGSLITTFRTRNISEYHYFTPPANNCGYIQIFQCYVIELIPIDEGGLQSLPGVPISGSSDMNATPYLEVPLKKGTLILYRYWIHDF